MNQLQNRIQTLLNVVQRWLSNDNEHLMRAAGRTVQGGYFAEKDVKYALKAVKKSINRTILEKWVEEAGISDENDAADQNVLCLHAGNLPLVGFQDAFVTLLSGARYTGKISKKDPYLLPSFLNEIKRTEIWNTMNVQWSHRLDDLEGMQNDAIVFAGSPQSVPGVMESIGKLGLAKKECRFLIRTAHFSMVYFDQRDMQTMEDLAKAVLRYGGMGCRSVAIIVSPFSLDSLKNELTVCFENFLNKNPQHAKTPARIEQQFAYNEAIGRPQIWLNFFLLQEGGLEFETDFICYWVQGGESTVRDLAKEYDEQLQSVYITGSNVTIPGYDGSLELLSNAQQPSIDWKPDGVDTLEWLTRR